jgi:Phage capsid family
MAVYLESQRGLTDTRILKSLAMADGDPSAAIALAMGQFWADTPQVIPILKAGISALSTNADGTGLIGPQSNDLLGVIVPLTILGRLQGLRRVPFDAALTAMTGGASASWVGEGQAVSISKPTFSRIATPLGRLKVVAMAVMDSELIRSADPSALLTIQQDFTRACVVASDIGFVDGAAAIANVRPASVTAGSPSFASGGSTALLFDSDLGKLIESLLARGSNLEYAQWIIHPITAAFLARLRNANGDYAYPSVTLRGGTLLGLPVIVSANIPHGGSPSIASIILVDAARVWLAEDAVMAFDVSGSATLQMLDNATQDAMTPTPTTQVSMFHTAAKALRGSRMLNFKIADPGFAAVLNGIAD